MHAPRSLTTHLLQEQLSTTDTTGEFFHIMTQVALAGKMIARDLKYGGLSDVLGSTGKTNVQGEEVQKLDERANEIFVSVFRESCVVRTLVSEEMASPYVVQSAEHSGRYVLYFDPLDGSSNIDVDASLGSVFSIHRLQENSSGDRDQELLKTGEDQVGAGYVLYGSSTVLVWTNGHGVHVFTLDPELGEFILTRENVRMPARGKIYCVNEGNRQKWSQGVQRYLDHIKESDSASGRPYTGRYSGCLAADVHRILLKGGIYLYPGEVKKPEGKLRLLYEAAPLTFIVEQAGGLGSTGVEPIRAIQPKILHQRVPLFIGSREDVEQVQGFIRA